MQYTAQSAVLSSHESSTACPIFSQDRAPVFSLWFMLALVPDHRRAQGRRHTLPTILMLAILALCCGSQSYEAMEEWARNYQDVLHNSVPFLARHMPDAATFHRVLTNLDVATFEQVLASWIATIAHPKQGEGIAIDGKTLSGTNQHLVAAFSHAQKSVLFQQGTTSKGKELVVGPQVLRHIAVKQQVITGDALFAQRSICHFLTKQKAGYVFTVKGNQQTLENDIRRFFATPPFGSGISQATLSEKVKGRVVTRTIAVTSDLNAYLAWPGLTHVWQMTRVIGSGNTKTTETAVGIARLLQKPSAATAQELNTLIRGHWAIENNLHRQRDVIFGEDRSTIRTRAAPQAMAALRNVITTLFYRAQPKSFTAAFRRFAAKPEELFAFFGLQTIATGAFS